ncbi:MAG: hypothetical protein JO304_03890 [Solirubrobacterales bacterium]|nr:hypothetical protein [Solirubrobacterales bacterium]
MFARTSTWTGSDSELDRWAAHVADTVRPMVGGLPGNAGAVFLVDRGSKRALTLTLWETEEAALASDQAAGRSPIALGDRPPQEAREMRRNHMIKMSAVIALALAAIAAPSASAQFDLASAGTPGGRAQSPTANASPVVQSNPDQQTTQSVPVGPPILPRAGVSEQAAINRAQAREAQALAYSLPPAAQYRMEELDANASAVHPVAATTPTVKAPGGGFDWGDAGIGAAGGLALSMLGLGGALVVSQRRTRQRTSATA